MAPPFTIRPATAADAAGYFSLEQSAYSPDLAESAETFLAYLRVFPAGCQVAELAGQLAGYLLSCPALRTDPPALNPAALTLPPHPDTFFLHNVTVAPIARNTGLGSALARTALEIGRRLGLRRFALVSVQDSAVFWKKFGFVPLLEPPESIARKLSTYGPTAQYMEYTLDG